MARVVQDVASAVTLPSGARIVIVITDTEGTFVGVGSNTSTEDATAILFCALAGADRIDHVTAPARLPDAMTPDRELAALRWLAGPQAFADQPDSADLGRVRRLGLARDAGGRIVITDAGRALLAELERKR